MASFLPRLIRPLPLEVWLGLPARRGISWISQCNPNGKLPKMGVGDFRQICHLCHWLVVWNMNSIFPNSWDDDPI